MRNRLTQLFAFHFFNDGLLACIILLLPFIKNDLNLSLTNIGFLTSLLSISGIILSLPAGYLGHKFGGLKILSLTLLFYGLGFIALGLSSSYVLLIISFLIAALGFGIFHPISFSLVAKWANPKNIGRTMGDFTAVGDIGRIAFSSFITFIIVSVGWKNTAFAYGFFSFIFLFLIFFLRKKEENPPLEEQKLSMNFMQILKNKKFIFAILTNFFDNLASSAIFIFLPFLLLKKNINPSFLSLFTGTFLIGSLFGKTILGRLSDKLKNTIVFISAEFFMAVFLFLLTTTSDKFFIVIYSVIIGILTSGTIPVRSTMVVESTKHHQQYEKVFSITSLFSTLATSLAPLILGYIADIYGVISSFYTAAAFALLAIVPAFLFSRQKNQDPIFSKYQ